MLLLQAKNTMGEKKIEDMEKELSKKINYEVVIIPASISVVGHHYEAQELLEPMFIENKINEADINEISKKVTEEISNRIRIGN